MMDIFSHLTRFKLRSSDRLIQLDAAYALAKTGDAEAIEILRQELPCGNWPAVQILDQINYKPQNAFERALFYIYHGRFRNAIAEGPITGKALYASLLWPRDNREHKMQAIQALAEIQAVEELIHYLYLLGKNVALVGYRAEVCRRLGELKDPRAVGVLLSELEVDLLSAPTVDCPPSVAHLSRRMAARALGEIGDSRALSGLTQSALRVEAASLDSAEAIKQIAGNRQAVEVLTGLLLQSAEIGGDPEIIATATRTIREWITSPYEYVACSFAFAVMEAAEALRQASYETLVQVLPPDRLNQILSAGEDTILLLEWVLEMGQSRDKSFVVYPYERLAVMLLVHAGNEQAFALLKRIVTDPAAKVELKKLAAHVLGSRLFTPM